MSFGPLSRAFPLLLALEVLLALAVGCGGRGQADASPVLLVAAASDLQPVFDDLAEPFAVATGARVSFTYGSSGALATQVAQGAPFDVFASASARFLDDVVRAKACDDATRTSLGRGHLALWNPSRDDVTLADLADDRFARIAIANPQTAPYGAAAQQALIAVGLWERLKARLVIAENVRQALQLATTGNADAALIALSTARAEPRGHVVKIADTLHAPLLQGAVVCTSGKNAALGRAFVEMLASSTSRARLQQAGFDVTGISDVVDHRPP